MDYTERGQNGKYKHDKNQICMAAAVISKSFAEKRGK